MAAASSSRREKLEALKMEIRAILVSANEGLSPNALDRDYADLNGHSIPFRYFGFPTLYHFLDELHDTLDAYQTDNGQIVLLPKSTGQTRHIESLVARQRKTCRPTRFGGIIQKPQEECHGTPERRTMITNRLLKLAAQMSPTNFVPYTELFDAYEYRYNEKVDTKDDFYCSNKALFEIKLTNYFDVQDPGKGAFYIKLKDSVREKMMNSGEMTMPNFPSGRIIGHPPPQQPTLPPPPPSGVTPKTVQAVQQQREVVEVEMRASSPERVPLSTLEQKKAANSTFPPGAATAFARAMDAVSHQPPPPVLASQRGRNISTTTAAPVVSKNILRQQSVPNTSTIPKKEESNLLPSLSQELSIDTTMTTNRIRSASTGNLKSTTTPTPSTLSASQFKENLRRLLQAYPRGVEITVFAWAFHLVTGEHLQDKNEKAILELLRKYPDVCDLIEKSPDRYLIKLKSTSPMFVAPKLSPGFELSSDKRSLKSNENFHHHFEWEKEKSANFLSKLRPDADLSGTACTRHDETNEDEENQDPVEVSREKLKEECRKVLQQFPAGVPYLDFAKHYKAINGKTLNLKKYGAISVTELVEMLPELFVLDNGSESQGLLKEKKVETMEMRLRHQSMPNAILKQEGEKTDLLKDLDKSQVKAIEGLINLVWDVISKQPSKSLFLNELPDAYQKVTGRAFPILSGTHALDDFGLTLMEVDEERFYFEYVDGKLEIFAEEEDE